MQFCLAFRGLQSSNLHCVIIENITVNAPAAKRKCETILCRPTDMYVCLLQPVNTGVVLFTHYKLLVSTTNV